MALLVVATDRDCSRLIEQIAERAADIELRLWPDIGCPDDIEFAVVWRHPPGLLAQLPALKAISSLGAGVEQLLSDPELPAELPVGRLSGPRLAADMAAYLSAQVLWHWRGLEYFSGDQRAARWQPRSPRSLPQIGLLGTGQLGRAAAAAFQSLELPVAGWNRSGHGPAGVAMHTGQSGLTELAASADYLICLLPLTSDTRDILDAQLFSTMKPDAVLINVGRGEHLVESDLLAALDQQQLALAILDVFRTEPLPPDHPFWTHPRIHITPHCSAVTRSDEAAELIIESYRRVRAGQPPLGLVDRARFY